MKINLLHFFSTTSRKMVFVCVIFFVASATTRGDEVGIQEALDLFYKNNYDIVKNKYEIDKASADLLEAKLRLNPNLSANQTGFNFTRSGITDIDNTQLAVRVDQPIRLGKKRELKVASAQENLEAAKLSYKDFIRNILVVFYTVYYNLCLDKLNIDFSRDELIRFDKTLEIGEKRYSTGFLSLNDYTKLKLAKIELENNITSFETKYQNDLEDFSLLLGSSKRLEPVKLSAQENFQEYTEENLLEKANRNRPDLLSIQKQIKASDYNLSLAKANRIPDVTVGLEYDSFGTDYKPGVGGGISVNLPIFNRNQAEISRKAAEHDQVRIQAEKVNKQIVTDVRQSLSNYKGFTKVFASYKSKKEEMKKLLENSEKAFSLGGITVLDLIDTRRTYKDFMTKYNQTLTQAMLSKELLKVFTGETR